MHVLLCDMAWKVWNLVQVKPHLTTHGPQIAVEKCRVLAGILES
jgi:hypothetical protein